jgi:hypothetical protein
MLNRRLIPLGLVTALAASTPALAVVDLDNTLDVPINIEAGALNVGTSTLRGAATTNPGRFANITVAGNNIDTISKAGIGFANGTNTFWRVDLTNAVFVTPVALGEMTYKQVGGDINDAADGITQGGALGDNFVIFNYNVVSANFASTGGFVQNANIGFAKTGGHLIGALGNAPVEVTVKSFTDVGNATNSINPLSTKGNTLMTFASTLTTTPVPANPQSNVSSLFTAFNAAGTALSASLGSVVLGASATVATVNPITNAATNVNLSEIGPVATGTTTITGDFSFGTWSMQAAGLCTAAVGLRTQLATLIAADKLSATVPSTNFVASGLNRDFLCVDTTAAEVVPATAAYTTSGGLGPLALVSMFAPGAQASSFGRITRNGSTVQVPYLTTFGDYNQRLTMVNRGTTDVSYSVAFTPETGTTAVAGASATGTVAAGTSLVVKATDIVTLTGKSRTAATVTIVSATGTLDVSTNQVAADGSTDTIVYAKNVL